MSAPSIKSIVIEEIEKISELGDFLRQQSEQEGSDGKIKQDQMSKTDKISSDKISCDNPKCQETDLVRSHQFEIYADNIVNICDGCYQKGYRLCLVSHEVAHISEMQQFGTDETYIHNMYKDNLIDLPDIDMSYQLMGIDNPCPTHTIVEADV